MMKRNLCARQNGFTIVELLIATMVFSVVLLLVTFGILQVSRVYYKGVTEANTQNVARGIMDSVSQAIQFSGGAVSTTPGSPVAGTSYGFCVNNQLYSYMLGYQLTDAITLLSDQTHHAMVVRTVPSCNPGSPQTLTGSVSGRELLSPHMRLADFEVNSVGTNLYQIVVRVVYGDKAILSVPSTAANVNCAGVYAGTQFCAVSDLTTTVVKRVQ